MPAYAIEPDEFGVIANLCQSVGEILLLLYGEKKVGLDTNDERAVQLQFLES